MLGFLQVGQVFVDDLQDQPRAACHAQLRVQPLQVGVDRVHGDGQFGGDGLIRCVLENEPHDLDFTPRKFQAIGNLQPLTLAEERLQASAWEAGGDHGGRFRGTKVQHWF
jgi:hypothetical protein